MTSPIRALISHFSFDFSHDSIEAVLQERPFEFCAFIATGSNPKYYSTVPESQQQWFESTRVRSCDYGDVDWNTLEPLDEAFIEKMRPCEALFMEDVCRLEWKYAISYTTRKQWYLKHLRFWNDYLIKNRINLYLSAWLPHQIPDVVLYHLCKYHNIPILYFHMSTERDTAFLEHDIEESAVQIADRYEELLQEYADVTDPMQIPLSERFDKRFKVLIARESQKPALESLKHKTYWGQVRSMIIRKPRQFLKYTALYCTPDGARRIYRNWRRRRSIRARNAFYNAHAIHPDFSKHFVYLALHFQPEASTVPMAGVYSRQVLIAQMLDAYLPDDILIYVKEHPKESAWLSRSVQDYKDLVAIPRVRLMAREADTFALREHCVAVATGTGSVGFEGLFRSKPVFMFGHRFYQYAKGVHRIHSKEDLQHAVQEVFEKNAKPSLIESRLYLKAMEDTCVHGTVNPWDRKVSHLNDEEHIRANSRAILEKLAQMEGEIAAIK